MEKMMTIGELRDYLIVRGIKSVKKTEEGSKRLGGIEGFKMCRSLNSPTEYREKIRELDKEAQEIFLRRLDLTKEETEQYWRITCQCIQVKFVHERLKCVWGSPNGFLSVRAMIDYSEILKRKEEVR